MKVKEIMTSNVKSCAPDTNLAEAARIMWEQDCGAVPVTDDRGAVVGVITDRDICIAAATRGRLEGEIPVREVMSVPVHACAPNDDVRAAMATMKMQQLRRLPVIGKDGQLAGVISIHDVAVQARDGQRSEIPAQDVLD